MPSGALAIISSASTLANPHLGAPPMNDSYPAYGVPEPLESEFSFGFSFSSCPKFRVIVR